MEDVEWIMEEMKSDGRVVIEFFVGYQKTVGMEIIEDNVSAGCCQRGGGERRGHDDDDDDDDDDDQNKTDE